MALFLNSPPVVSGNVSEQLMQLRSYVYQTVETLNVDIKIRFNGDTYYMSDIVSACNL